MHLWYYVYKKYFIHLNKFRRSELPPDQLRQQEPKSQVGRISSVSPAATGSTAIGVPNTISMGISVGDGGDLPPGTATSSVVGN